MKKYKLTLVLTTALILLSFLLAGCQSGIPQAQYDQVNAQLRDAQAQVTQLQGQIKDLTAQKDAASADLKTALAKIAELQGQVGGLKEQATLTGATPAETAAKIVKNYHETHVYSSYDLFVCSDMAAEVWNMLKAQGIRSIIAVGNKDTAITDIIQSDHAWVLAEVASGEYLALETTGGYVVPGSQNKLYYRGWSFDSPADLKKYGDLVKEYNVRVGIRNQINNEANEVAVQHNNSTSQIEADKYKAVYDKLVEIREAQEAELNNINSEINGLASVLR
jgi:outer membrane murein-binding lipoprotein Lpp